MFIVAVLLTTSVSDATKEVTNKAVNQLGSKARFASCWPKSSERPDFWKSKTYKLPTFVVGGTWIRITKWRKCYYILSGQMKLFLRISDAWHHRVWLQVYKADSITKCDTGFTRQITSQSVTLTLQASDKANPPPIRRKTPQGIFSLRYFQFSSGSIGWPACNIVGTQ